MLLPSGLRYDIAACNTIAAFLRSGTVHYHGKKQPCSFMVVAMQLADIQLTHLTIAMLYNFYIPLRCQTQHKCMRLFINFIEISQSVFSRSQSPNKQCVTKSYYYDTSPKAKFRSHKKKTPSDSEICIFVKLY